MNPMQSPNTGVGGSAHGNRKEIPDLTKGTQFPCFRPLTGLSVHVWNEQEVYLGVGTSGHSSKSGGTIRVGGRSFDSNYKLYWRYAAQESGNE